MAGQLQLWVALGVGLVVLVLWLLLGRARAQREQAKAELRARRATDALNERVNDAVARVRQDNVEAERERESDPDSRSGGFGTFHDRVRGRAGKTGVQPSTDAEFTDDPVE